jgi:hypothetical protein
MLGFDPTEVMSLLRQDAGTNKLMNNETQSNPAVVSRREFLKGVSALAVGGSIMADCFAAGEPSPARGSKSPAVLKVAFIRNPAPLSGGWPGHGFNNDVACKAYAGKLESMGRELGITVDLEHADVPFTDESKINRFISATQERKPDALLVCPIGIFTPWDKAEKVFAATKLPTLVFTQIGTSFTMNTAPLARRSGFYLVSASDIADLRPGLEMVRAQKAIAQATLLVVGRNDYKGTRFEGEVFGKVGTRLKFLPGQAYIDAYASTPVTDDVRALAAEVMQEAKEIREVSRDDILQAARHYFAAKQLLADHQADGLTSVCLHVCGKVGTPCLGYSKLMDEGTPAGCESDIGSAMTMLLIHKLLGRPGYMADPLVDTSKNLFVNAHCNCPTRLEGFGAPRQPYVVRSHHAGGHWVSLQVLWRVGQPFTLVRFQRPDLLLVDRAKVVCNYESPPSAACITNVGAVVEGAEDDPHKVAGFHVLQVYGDHTAQLRAYAQLYGLEAVHSWDPRVSFDFQPNCV